MNYFGYNDSSMDNYIKKFKERNIIVIEDITHRLLCNKNHSQNSDYLICSLRKLYIKNCQKAILLNSFCKIKRLEFSL